jgi:hypothetical protein
MEPKNIDWRNYVGGLYTEKGDYAKARVHLEYAYSLNSESFDSNLKLARLNYLEQNK